MIGHSIKVTELESGEQLYRNCPSCGGLIFIWELSNSHIAGCENCKFAVQANEQGGVHRVFGNIKKYCEANRKSRVYNG